MSEIEIDVAKSWNELRWIDDQAAYRLHLAQFSKGQIKEAQNLAHSGEVKEWSSANIHLSSLLHAIESLGIITKPDLDRTIAKMQSDSIAFKESREILTRNLITCIYLIQNSLLQRGKKTKVDIAKIAAIALQTKFQSRKEYVYIYKDIVYPYFSCYDIAATLQQIKKGSSAEFVWNDGRSRKEPGRGGRIKIQSGITRFARPAALIPFGS